jgi:anti-sigma regulatory factor (Ser/Thr protein kinase)
MVSHIESYLTPPPLQISVGNLTPNFFTPSAERTLQHILKQPYRYFIEAGAHNAVQNSLFQLLAQSPDFAINLTCKTAHNEATALTIAEHLHHRFGIQKYRTLQIHTCIQESLSNAIIHGNLELNSLYKNAKDYDAFYELVQSRMQQPSFSERRITVVAWHNGLSLRVAVSDQGKGFSIPDYDPNNIAPHGRGLMLIRSLCDDVYVGDDRRTLWMMFHT